MLDNPKDYGLPHDTWRPSQKDAFNQACYVLDSGSGDIVVEAPVGTGKSGIATALGVKDKVTVLVQNHGLLTQYEKSYGFDVIRGRQEYPCILKSKIEHWNTVYNLSPTAADCHFHDPQSMCPAASNCPYFVARNNALSSDRMACTYKYASLSKAVKDREGILVLDETHNAYEEFLSISQFVMDDIEAKKWKFKTLPLYRYGPNGEGDLLDKTSKDIVIDWLVNCISLIAQVNIFNQVTPDGSEKQRILDKLLNAVNILRSDKPLFYKCNRPSSDDIFSVTRRQNCIMQIRMIDVKDTMAEIKKNKRMTMFMSATIGNPQPLMTMLGVSNYKYFAYPHPIPSDKRPVYDLGIPKMTKSNLDARPTLYKEQAQKIAQFIRTLDKDWRGIILTTSNYKIGLMRRFLKDELNGRVFEPRETSVTGRINEFITNKQKGLIAVDTIQGWGSGISLDGNIARFAVAAGVPYINPADRFDAIRTASEEGKRYAFWNAYSAVVQTTGRVTRGEIEDDGSFMLNVSALADGSATSPMALASYPVWFKEAITHMWY